MKKIAASVSPFLAVLITLWTLGPKTSHAAEHWYTVTLLKGQGPKAKTKIPYAYYMEKMEPKAGDKKGEVQFTLQLWKLEEGFLNEEQIGIIASEPPALIPRFYNFRSLYRTTETLIDGTLKDGYLQARTKVGTEPGNSVKKAFPKNGFLSSLFTYWVIHHVPATPGKTASYQAVFEDEVKDNFTPVQGRLTVLKPDAPAVSAGDIKIKVEQQGIESTWWIDAKGSLLRMESPQNQRIVERASKEKAQSFLKGKTE